MESQYGHPHQTNWAFLPDEYSFSDTAGSSTVFNESFANLTLHEIPVLQPETEQAEDSTTKNVMKKMAMIVMGVTLFIAGYHHTRKQTEYVTAKAAIQNPNYAKTPTVVPENMKQTVAFRLVKPS